MILPTDLKTKTMDQTEPGELIKYRTQGKVVTGIVLQVSKDDTRVGTLQGVNARRPYPTWVDIKCINLCVSLGTSWLLNPLLDESQSWAGDTVEDYSGALFLGGTDYFVAFAPHSDKGSDEIFHLNKLILTTSIPEEAVPFKLWEIWQNERAFNSPGHEPVIKVKALEVTS